ncbi:hypothetical protein CTAYLR_003435 [Chrysophaeum taylorii]|uniref:CAAX prenyl protease 2/Lysostaphin resistance protein A-like domain-containing protein n=1 Tax=Chrysophaeum taylorii TaxID=2483200 RepID=A0AAD7U7K2_9STRA|nr:hypothetical protein CTAYLR_003435 [Chrysophaeum taylorii]
MIERSPLPPDVAEAFLGEGCWEPATLREEGGFDFEEVTVYASSVRVPEGLAEAAILAAASGPSLDRSNVGGFHSDDDVFETCEAARPLRDAAFKAVAELPPEPPELATVEDSTGATIVRDDRFLFLVPRRVEAWFNVSKCGHYNCLHDHRGARWCGVYFVQCPDPPPPPLQHSGGLLLLLRHPNPPERGRYAVIHPVPGTMLLFPPSLRHAVLPVAPAAVHEGGGKNALRISVSFNFGCAAYRSPPSMRRQQEVPWRRVARRVDNAQRKVLERTKGLHPASQLGIVGAAYACHTCLLSRGCLPYPVQLIPNDRGLFQSIGYDSLAGMLVIALRWIRVASREKNPRSDLPWKPAKATIDARRFVGVVLALFGAFSFSATACVALDGHLYRAAYDGATISLAMHRALLILFGHLVWVAGGLTILTLALDNFWAKNAWFRFRWRDDWMWWVIGGYACSSWAFNCADALNQFIVPDCLFDDDTLVTQMINPEDNDIFTFATGAVAPCLSAPFWEETLYRGFLLPRLISRLDRRPRLCGECASTPQFASCMHPQLLFAAHHFSLTAGFPLAVLGLIWALVYIQSRNLLVTVLIHAMWNTRIFLGALLGL